MKKRIFVIGANSTIGKEVVAVLAKNNQVITAGVEDCDVYCDITKKVNIPEKIDTLINFAASFGGPTDEEISQAINVNLLGLLNICVAAKKASVGHFINLSSIYALLNEGEYNYSIYSITKKQADELAQFYCHLNKIPLTILRPSRVYGDSEKFAKNQPFLYQIINKAQKGEDILIYGKHDAKRNYLHCADLAEIINRTAVQPVEGIYPCVFPSDVTYSQVARVAQKIFGGNGSVKFINNKPNIADDLHVQDLGLYKKIGFEPGISVEGGLRRIKAHKESVAA